MNNNFFMYVLFLLCGIFSLSMVASEQEEKKIKYAVVSQMMLAQEVVQQPGMALEQEKKLFDQYVNSAHSLVDKGDHADILINAELLAAAALVFRSIYRAVLEREMRCASYLFKQKEVICLMVGGAGYRGDAASGACFEMVVDKKRVPGIWLESLEGDQMALTSCFALPSLAYCRVRAVLWHELGHYKLHHALKDASYQRFVQRRLKFACSAVIGLYGFSLYGYLSCQGVELKNHFEWLSLLSSICLVGPALVAEPLLMFHHSKKNEYEADVWGINYAEEVQYARIAHLAYVSMLSRDLWQGVSKLRLMRKRLYASHPTPQERLKAVIKYGCLRCLTQEEREAYKQQAQDVVQYVAYHLLEEVNRSIILQHSKHLCALVDAI